LCVVELFFHVFWFFVYHRDVYFVNWYVYVICCIFLYFMLLSVWAISLYVVVLMCVPVTRVCGLWTFRGIGSVIVDTNKYACRNITSPITNLTHVFIRSFSRMSWQYATTHEIEKVIKTLKMKNSYGHVEISSRIIKLSAPFIISPLTYICNAILSTGVSRTD
jgi:hypothetical protein